MTLHVLFEVRRRLELFFAGLAGVDSDARQLFAMLLQVKGELALQDKLIAALRTDQILQGKRGGNGSVASPERSAARVLTIRRFVTDLLLLVQHDVRFETGDAGEPFVADRAGEVGCLVRGLVEREVELHVKRLRAVVTSVRLPSRDEAFQTFSQVVSLC